MSEQVESHLRDVGKEYFMVTEQQELPPIKIETETGGRLTFVGTKHTNNPDDPFFGRLRTEWNDFLKKQRKGHKPIVVLEGWRDGPLSEISESDIIRSRGEVGLMDTLAIKSEIEIRRYEPPEDEEFEQLADEFGAQTVFYWMVARQATQWAREDTVARRLPWNKKKRAERHDRVTDTHLSDYVSLLEGALGHSPSFNEISRSFAALQDTHRELFNSELDWNDTKHFYHQANPTESNSVINDIHRASNKIRDEYLFKKLEKDLHEAADLFVVYGDGHAWSLQDKLRRLE